MRRLLPLFVVVLAACGGGSNKPADNAKAVSARVTPAFMAGRIHAMEDSIFANPAFDRRGAIALLDVYQAFARAYPTDSLAPEYLVRAAGIQRNLKDPQAAINLYDRVIRDYPDWNDVVVCYYQKGLIYQDDLKQLGEAKTAYEEVARRFPDHVFGKEAKIMIENLQYTDEELIERFRQQNGEEQAGR